MAVSTSLQEFQKILLEKFQVTLKESRGRFSYLHPKRTKPITGKNLGANYEKKFLLKIISGNTKLQKPETA